MICNICNEREATIEYTAVVGDAKKTMYLCQECSKQQGSEQETDKQADGPAQKVTPKHVVETKKVDVIIGPAGTESGKGPCPGCGMTYDEFRKVGRLGCSHCYEAFGAPLRRLLKRIHGADTHIGRGPRPSGLANPGGNADVQTDVQTDDQTDDQTDETTKSIGDLRSALDAAVGAEDYEQAAALRDRIARLEEDRQ